MGSLQRSLSSVGGGPGWKSYLQGFVTLGLFNSVQVELGAFDLGILVFGLLESQSLAEAPKTFYFH